MAKVNEDKVIGVNETETTETETIGVAETRPAKVTEAELTKEIKNFKEYLDKQPKVSIMIPEDPLNPDDVVPIGINGVIYAIPRGQMFEVPKPIADIWNNSYKETQKANQKIRKSMEKDIQIMG